VSKFEIHDWQVIIMKIESKWLCFGASNEGNCSMRHHARRSKAHARLLAVGWRVGESVLGLGHGSQPIERIIPLERLVVVHGHPPILPRDLTGQREAAGEVSVSPTPRLARRDEMR
jgi:hypothetical protein